MAEKKVRSNGAETKAWQGYCSATGVNLGTIILLLGLYMLFKDMGWIHSRLSFWTLLFLVLGLWLILGGVSRRRCC